MEGQVVFEESSVSKRRKLMSREYESELRGGSHFLAQILRYPPKGISSSSRAKKNALGVRLAQGFCPQVVFCINWDFVPKTAIQK